MLKIFRKALHIGIKTERLTDFESQTMDELQQTIFKTFGRSLGIRHVDAGSCNGCELECQAVQNPFYNIEGYGLYFVASPRHADVLLVTGPVSRNMAQALKKTYAAMPSPKWVVALGDCGSCGGIFGDENYAHCGAISNVIPVDAAIKGCPPHPKEIIKGIITMIMTQKPKESALIVSS